MTSKQNLQMEVSADKLAILGETIVIIGEAINTIAEILAQEEEDAKINMQKQIDYLMVENEKLKNELNRKKPNWL